MKKIILMLIIISFPFTVFGQEKYRIGIDGKKHIVLTEKEKKLSESINKEIKSRIINTPKQPPKRKWVEDVYQPGKWYYGYYIHVNGSWEFLYYKVMYSGLTNFSSLYHVQNKHIIKNGDKPIRVIYEKP